MVNKVESKFIDREREILQKLIIHGGPLNHFTDHMRFRLRDYRQSHPDFNDFLLELREYLIGEKQYNFSSLIKFIDDKSEGNWISNPKSIFGIMIKLYNLCLSPKQASDYIKRCYRLYQFMLNADYKLCQSYEVLIRRDSWDGNAKKFIVVNAEPNKHSQEWGDEYWFHVTLSSTIISTFGNTSATYELRTGADIFEDTLRLFEYSQECYLRKKILNFILKELDERKIISLVNTEENPLGWTVYTYDIKDEPGGYYSIDKHIKQKIS